MWSDIMLQKEGNQSEALNEGSVVVDVCERERLRVGGVRILDEKVRQYSIGWIKRRGRVMDGRER